MKASLSREKEEESTSIKEQSAVEWRAELVRIELQDSHRNQRRTRALEIRIKLTVVVTSWSAIIL